MEMAACSHMVHKRASTRGYALRKPATKARREVLGKELEEGEIHTPNS